MSDSIKSKELLLSTIRLLSLRHWNVYEDESVVGGDRIRATQARQALDAYAFALEAVRK